MDACGIIPPMVVIADKKRRVVLPKTAKPGDAFECVPSGSGYVLEKLQRLPKSKPPVAKRPADKRGRHGD